MVEPQARPGDPRAVDSLTIADLRAFPIWQFTHDESQDETLVLAVKETPVASLAGRIVGTKITLASGEERWALIGNVDPTNARLNEHFLTLSVEHQGCWFPLARYHDFDVADHGPEALARLLGLDVDQAFPICYDIRYLVNGDEAALRGKVLKTPRERLSRSELIAMSVP